MALWRHRIALLLATFGVVALGVYEIGFAVPTVSNGDCADTAMTALTRADDASARAAYACLGSEMRTSSEDQFVASMRGRGAPAGRADRIADRRTPDGGRIVFFTVAGNPGVEVGYIVYLNPEGKIAKVE